jgi:acyl-CoA thioesterase
VFGLSFGITLATISWFMSFLRPRRVTGWLLLGVLATGSAG